MKALLLVVVVGVALAADGEAAELAAGSPWLLPPPGGCQPGGGEMGALPDARPFPFQPGDTFGVEQLELLKDFIPAELWTYRDRFFYEGMRLEIGPCYADYSPPEFYREATNVFGDGASLEFPWFS